MRQQLTIAEFELTDATVEQFELEGLLGFAEHVLGNSRALWVQATAEQKVRLQAVLFLEGIPFDGSRFGTAVTCLAFAQLPEQGGQIDGVASLTVPTWNQLRDWLREMDGLRAVLGGIAA